MTHDGFDRQGVRNEAGIFYVLRKDRPCFFAGGFVGHNVFILSKMMRPDIPHPKVISSKLSLGNEYSIPSQGLCPNWDRIAATKNFQSKDSFRYGERVMDYDYFLSPQSVDCKIILVKQAEGGNGRV
jgi:hypothetical protein